MKQRRNSRAEEVAVAEKAAAVEDARAEVDAGKTVPYAKVRRWLMSWGTRKEQPRPKCK